MNLNRTVMRFDRRLVTRHLREGLISLDELNLHLASLPDEAHLIWDGEPDVIDELPDDEDEYDDEDEDEDDSET